MKLSDLLGTGAPVVIKNINIINTNSEKEEEPIINPGIEYGNDDKAKWSPPLQQELSVMKSAIGSTPDADTTELNPEIIDKNKQGVTPQTDDQVEFIKKLVAIFSR